MNDRFPDIFYTIPHAPWPTGWICTDIGSRYFAREFSPNKSISYKKTKVFLTKQTKVFLTKKQKYFLQKTKVFLTKKQKYFLQKTSPRVFADSRPHDEEHPGPNQGELCEKEVEVEYLEVLRREGNTYEEGVEVGGRLGHNVPHQVDSATREVVELFHWCHLESN